MTQSDYSTLGAAYRSEADRTFTRAVAFAVLLVFVHLLEIKPSEVDALGLKIGLTDPIVLFGIIALIFGYYLSRALWHGEKGESFLPLRWEPARIRANLRLAKRTYLAEKKNRGRAIDFKKIKTSARHYMIFTDIAVAPYFIIISLFVIAALPLMAIDLLYLGEFVFSKMFPD